MNGTIVLYRDKKYAVVRDGVVRNLDVYDIEHILVPVMDSIDAYIGLCDKKVMKGAKFTIQYKHHMMIPDFDSWIPTQVNSFCIETTSLVEYVNALYNFVKFDNIPDLFYEWGDNMECHSNWWIQPLEFSTTILDASGNIIRSDTIDIGEFPEAEEEYNNSIFQYVLHIMTDVVTPGKETTYWYHLLENGTWKITPRALFIEDEVVSLFYNTQMMSFFRCEHELYKWTQTRNLPVLYLGAAVGKSVQYMENCTLFHSHSEGEIEGLILSYEVGSMYIFETFATMLSSLHILMKYMEYYCSMAVGVSSGETIEVWLALEYPNGSLIDDTVIRNSDNVLDDLYNALINL